MLLALVLAGCGHRAPPPVMHEELGESHVEPQPVPVARDAGREIVQSGPINTRIRPAGEPPPPPAVTEEPPPPPPDARPNVMSPPPSNP